MADLTLDRLLETCHRRNASDILLRPGGPPLIRVHDCWRSLQTGPVTPADIKSISDEIINPPAPSKSDGYHYYDFWHGKLAQFRIMAFDYPNTTALILMRHPVPISPPSPPSPTDFFSR